jgi:hypothetical protein
MTFFSSTARTSCRLFGNPALFFHFPNLQINYLAIQFNFTSCGVALALGIMTKQNIKAQQRQYWALLECQIRESLKAQSKPQRFL